MTIGSSEHLEQPAVPQRRGGLLLRVRGELVFLPAQVAVSIDPPPSVVRVPGAPAEMLGIAVHAGEIVPVVALGEEKTAMVVCRYATEPTATRELIGLVGASIVGAGSFEVEPGGTGDRVAFLGESARTLDLALVYARLQGGAWAGRWGG